MAICVRDAGIKKKEKRVFGSALVNLRFVVAAAAAAVAVWLRPG